MALSRLVNMVRMESGQWMSVQHTTTSHLYRHTTTSLLYHHTTTSLLSLTVETGRGSDDDTALLPDACPFICGDVVCGHVVWLV